MRQAVHPRGSHDVSLHFRPRRRCRALRAPVGRWRPASRRSIRRSSSARISCRRRSSRRSRRQCCRARWSSGGFATPRTRNARPRRAFAPQRRRPASLRPGGGRRRRSARRRPCCTRATPTSRSSANRTADDTSEAFSTELAKAVVTSCGRPVLFVPYVGEYKTVGERVMIAWKDSRESARAVADALPLLKDAKKVFAVAITPDPDDNLREMLADAQVAAFLGRHEVDATVRRIARSGYRCRRAAALASGGFQRRPDRDGRVFAAADQGVHVGRRDARDAFLDDGAGADVALKNAAPQTTRVTPADLRRCSPTSPLRSLPISPAGGPGTARRDSRYAVAAPLLCAASRLRYHRGWPLTAVSQFATYATKVSEMWGAQCAPLVDSRDGGDGAARASLALPLP